MKHTLSLITFALLVTGCGGSSKKDDDVVVVTPPSALMQQAEQDRISNNAGAISVAIYHKGEVVFADAVGNKQPNSTEKADKNTLFQIGSTTKVLTSIAALQLVEQNRLALTDKLVDHLPNINFPTEHTDFWQAIELEWLMTHKGAFEDDYEGISEDSDLISFMRDEYTIDNGVLNQPGLFYNYSNPNYSYLGAVIALESGLDYAGYVEQEVFTPLAMTRSTFSNEKVKADGNFALSINDANDQIKKHTSIDELLNSEVVLPAGGNTWSTPTEMLNLAKLLLKGNENVLTQASSQTLTGKHVLIPNPLPVHYGYGMFVSDGFMYDNKWYPIRHFEHGGNANAYTSLFYVFPDHDLAISVLSSGESDNLSGTLIAALKHVNVLPEAQPFQLPAVNFELFDKFAGDYTVYGLDLTITNASGKLQVSMPTLDAQGVSYSETLTPISANMFALTLNDQQLAFNFVSTNGGQSYDYFVSRQAVATRKGSKQQTTQNANSKVTKPIKNLFQQPKTFLL